MTGFRNLKFYYYINISGVKENVKTQGSEINDRKIELWYTNTLQHCSIKTKGRYTEQLK